MRYSDRDITIDNFDLENIEIDDFEEAKEFFDYACKVLKENFAKEYKILPKDMNYVAISQDENDSSTIYQTIYGEGISVSW